MSKVQEEGSLENQSTNTQPSSNIKAVFKIVVVVLAVGVLGYFFYRQKSAYQPSPLSNSRPTLSESTSPTSTQEVQTGEVKEIVVEGREFSYSPSSISVSKGEKVRINFKNLGNAPHNLVIDELGVSTKAIPSGASDTVEFTANKTGTFTFYCSIGNHRNLGMEGDLVVD